MPELAVLDAVADAFRGLFWILACVGVWTMVVRRTPKRPDAASRALHVLNERYARGDIDRDEYLERRAYLD